LIVLISILLQIYKNILNFTFLPFYFFTFFLFLHQIYKFTKQNEKGKTTTIDAFNRFSTDDAGW